MNKNKRKITICVPDFKIVNDFSEVYYFLTESLETILITERDTRFYIREDNDDYNDNYIESFRILKGRNDNLSFSFDIHGNNLYYYNDFIDDNTYEVPEHINTELTKFILNNRMIIPSEKMYLDEVKTSEFVPY